MIISDELLALAAGFAWSISVSLNGLRGRTTGSFDSSSAAARPHTFSTAGGTQGQGLLFGEIYRRRAPCPGGSASSAPGLKGLLSPLECDGASAPSSYLGEPPQRYVSAAPLASNACSLGQPELGTGVSGTDLRKGPNEEKEVNGVVPSSSASAGVSAAAVGLGCFTATAAAEGLGAAHRPAQTEQRVVHSSCAALVSVSSSSAASITSTVGEAHHGSSDTVAGSRQGSISDADGSSSSDDDENVGRENSGPLGVAHLSSGSSFELMSNPVAACDGANGDDTVADRQHLSYPPNQPVPFPPCTAAGVWPAQLGPMQGPAAISEPGTGTWVGGLSSSDFGGSSVLVAAAQLRAAMSASDPGAAITAAALALAAAMAQRCTCGGAVAALPQSQAQVRGFDMCRVRCNISFIPEERQEQAEEEEEDGGEQEDDDEGAGGEVPARAGVSGAGRGVSGDSGALGMLQRPGAFRTGRSQSVCEGVYKLRRLQLPTTPAAALTRFGQLGASARLGPDGGASAAESAAARSAAAPDLQSAASAPQPNESDLPKSLCECCTVKDGALGCSGEQRDCHRHRDQVGGRCSVEVPAASATAAVSGRVEGSPGPGNCGWERSSCGGSSAAELSMKDDPMVVAAEAEASPCSRTAPQTPSPAAPRVVPASPCGEPHPAAGSNSDPVGEPLADGTVAVDPATVAVVPPRDTALPETPLHRAPSCGTPSASPRPMATPTSELRQSACRLPFSSIASPPALPATPSPSHPATRGPRRSSLASPRPAASPHTSVGGITVPDRPSLKGAAGLVRNPRSPTGSLRASADGSVDLNGGAAPLTLCDAACSTPFSRARLSTAAAPLSAVTGTALHLSRRLSNASDVSVASSGGMTTRSTASTSVFCGGANNRHGHHGTAAYGRNRAMSCLSTARPPASKQGQQQQQQSFTTRKASVAAVVPASVQAAAAANAALELSRRRQAREQAAGGGGGGGNRPSYLRPTMSSAARALTLQKSLQAAVLLPVQPATAPAPLPLQAVLR